ncbi:Hsp20/alpha crystallin family protein [Macrococcus animalis]|uniref:Hsp20/alpha crystallin family protein n=1 Tax=Macrococcus animalis TaxID=3395467 RepID=UPI0039BEE7F8
MDNKNSIFSRGQNVFDVANEMLTKSVSQFADNAYNHSFKLDIKETSNEYTVQVDLPGINQDDIQLDYQNDALNITAKRNEEVVIEEPGQNYIKRERTFGSMHRSLYLPDVNVETIKATFKKNGTLDIVLPKLHVTEAPKQSIKINSEF